MSAAGASAAEATGWRWLPIAALVVVVDQLSKVWIERNYSLYETTIVLPVLSIVRWHNTGAAFSFLAAAGGWQRWLFAGLAVAISIVILLWLRRLSAVRQPWLGVGLALVMGGAIGNLIDRMRNGFVIDFILVHWKESLFPAFNVADSAITIGAGLLLLDALSDWRRGRNGGLP